MQKIYSIRDENRELAIQVIPSKRKTISIQVAADLQVQIRCPLWFTEKQTRQFIEKEQSKIFSLYDKASAKFESIGSRLSYEDIYADGKRIPLGDGEITLRRIQTRDENHIRVYRKKEVTGEGVLCMASGIENAPEAYRQAVTGWLRECARVELSELVQQYAQKMQVRVGKITIREQKTRWGSCSSQGNLNFNWKLVLMPKRIQEYVVVHELAHRKEMNHSPAFWSIVAAVLPDYSERRKWLKAHESEFSIF